MTHSNTSEAAAQSLSIREFARYYGHAEAVVRRAMRQISVRGTSQGRGRPTLLSPEDQEQLLDHIEGPEEADSQDRPEPEPEVFASEAYASQEYAAHDSQESETYDSGEYDSGEYGSGEYSSATYESRNDESRGYGTEVYESGFAEKSTDNPESDAYVATTNASKSPETQTYELALQPSLPIQAPPQATPEAPIQRTSHYGSSYSDSGYEANAAYDDSHSAPYAGKTMPHTPRDYELQISPGNHRLTVETPEIPRTYDLGQFRSDEAVPALADPGEIASQAMAAIDSLVAGMDADIRQQRNQLSQTQKAAKALRIKAKKLHEKKLEYMIQSSAIGQAQQQSTAELQEALGEVQALGKSPRSEQEPPSP